VDGMADRLALVVWCHRIQWLYFAVNTVGRVCYTRGYFQGHSSPHPPLVQLFNKLSISYDYVSDIVSAYAGYTCPPLCELVCSAGPQWGVGFQWIPAAVFTVGRASGRACDRHLVLCACLGLLREVSQTQAAVEARYL
jgi:hypothetical protein